MRPVSSKAQRGLFAAFVAATALLTFGIIGGLGVSHASVGAAQYEYGPPQYQYGVVLCHAAGGQTRVTVTVSVAAVRAHLAHGDTPGSCP